MGRREGEHLEVCPSQHGTLHCYQEKKRTAWKHSQRNLSRNLPYVIFFFFFGRVLFLSKQGCQVAKANLEDTVKQKMNWNSASIFSFLREGMTGTHHHAPENPGLHQASTLPLGYIPGPAVYF